MFDRLRPPAPDALVEIAAACRADPRPDKIDLGIGVYRDANGDCPVFASVKAAEGRLVSSQTSKAYVGPFGDGEFCERLAVEVLGARRFADHGSRLLTVQAPGGTGALRLAAELVRASDDRPVAWLGDPSWPAHAPLLSAVGFEVRPFAYAEGSSVRPNLQAIVGALSNARRGDLVVLQGCCHNPTGVDLAEEDWVALSRLFEDRGLIPLIDLAYLGLGHGFESDAWGVRFMLDALPEAMVAVSCSKAFGLYRERTGALLVKCADLPSLRLARAQLTVLARLLWSMPPDHGASVVREILGDPRLAIGWRDEVAAMRERLRQLRLDLAAAARDRALDLDRLGSQLGLFALMPLDRAQVRLLREDHGVYLADNGRANLAGLRPANLDRFCDALARVVQAATPA